MFVKEKNAKGRNTRDVATFLILSWLFMLDGAWCEDVPSFNTKFPINNIAVSKNHVFIAAGHYLYQLTTSLQTVVVKVEGRWNVSLKCPGHKGSLTPENKLLVVSQEAGLVYTGWNWGDSEIEKRNLSTITQIVVNQTKAVSCVPGVPSHGLVFNDTQGRIYIAIATDDTIKKYNDKLVVPESSTLTIQKEGTFHSVDAFEWDSFIYMPYTSNSSRGPTMLITNRGEDFKDCGEVLLQCGGTNARRNLVSSAFIKGHDAEAVWAGIFTVDNRVNSANDTALCIFSVKKMEELVSSTKCDDSAKLFSRKDIPVQTPILKPSTLTHGNLSSVHGIVVRKHIVIFMGTGNGQLLKVTLDGNMTAGCPEVLYEIKEETPVLPRLAIDPLDKRYIYLPTTCSVKRVKVANCDQYKSCSQCLMAADPYCGWCHSDARCTFEEECASGSISQYWVSVLEGAGRCLQIQFRRNLQHKTTHFTKLPENKQCRVKNTTNKNIICESSIPCPLDWPCQRLNEQIFDDIIIEIVLNNRTVSERFPFSSCSKTHSRCSPCVLSGCIWCKAESSCKSPYTPCSPQDIAADQSACSLIDTEPSAVLPADVAGSQCIKSIEPKRVSSEGKLRVTIIGQNLTEQTKIVLLGTSTCRPLDVKVLRKLNDSHLEVSLPPDRKETKTLCVNFDGKNCCSREAIQYIALPTCSHIFPNKTWLSGGRKLTVVGRNLDVIDNLTVSHARISSLNQTLRCSGNESHCHLLSPSLGAESLKQKLSLRLKTGGNAVDCGALEYLADPKFTSYSADYNVDTELRLVIEKENDDLDIEVKDLAIVVTYDNTSRPCPIQNITQNIRNSVIHCKLSKDVKDNPKITKVTVTMGNFTTAIEQKPSSTQFHMLSFLVIIPLLLIIIVAAIFITRRKEREFSRKLSQQIELLECDMRNQIRSGFAELQIDQSDVVDTAGTIPFLDYKHFAIRTFFPESTSPNSTLVEVLCNAVPPPFQSPGANRNDESLTLLRALICNKPFLVTLIHILEKKKEFTIKDRCRFASFLTVALQSKLVYLTHILEVLIRDLMEQSSNAQPKLMLRRTESVVEKLLTNWMSTCLYGFLRETVGEPLYLLVTTLNQRIHKGPVDAITCKALYTLNEDWILWQVTDFSTLTIHVVFPGLSGSESGEDLGQTIPVKVLDCDSIGQAKEKFFQAFLSKNNYAYGLTVCETTLELHVGQDRKELKDVDKSSVTLEHGKTKLNTVMHYQIADGSTVTVIKKNSTCTSDGDYTDDYCHLILPDSEAGDDFPGKHHKDKQKFKVKEMSLTKLISTKVAIDPAVETLFSSILSLPGNRVPVAIKFFFDFLDTLYDSKKINDADIPHIWKTNSLPLRFWVNILKNPQFVFDIKQTAHIDSCLSVIAQAFIDSFSLSEQMLGKDSPTNKLLYAKDMARYKWKVKEYYAGIQSSPSLSSAELEEFLNQESKKHENEFKEDAALLELYKYIASYYDEILCKLEKEPELQDATKQLIRMKYLFEDKKKCSCE